MSKYSDFLFVYEVKPRELETMALLTYELRRRGYSVSCVNTWKNMNLLFKRRHSCNVVLGYGAYNTLVVDFVLDYVKTCKKFVNLQWEQLLSMGQMEDKDSYYYIQGKAKDVVHLCWGEENYDRLVKESGIEPEKAKLVGHVGMDYMRPEFIKYYYSRDEICEQYNIDKNKRMLLFISSFSYVNVPGRMANLAGDTFAQFNVDSQEIILKWFTDMLEVRKDIVLVYRPHPAEADNQVLLDMQKRFDNFRVIVDYSVKQWITVADQIYNWYSTSIMEVYMGHKSCYILRPVKVNPADDMTIFQNAEYIKDYDSFMNTIDRDDFYFPIPESDINRIYYVDKNEPSYLKFADELEKIIKSDEYNLPENFENKWIFDKRLFLRKLPFVKLYLYLSRKIKAARGDEKAKEQIAYDDYCKQMADRNNVSDSELYELAEKIGKIIEGNKKSNE